MSETGVQEVPRDSGGDGDGNDSFNAIICVNGKPFNVIINGLIGSEIT